MPELLSSIGRFFLFATLLPGVIGLFAILVLFPAGTICVQNIGPLNITMIVFGIGFVANALGDFLEYWFRPLINRISNNPEYNLSYHNLLVKLIMSKHSKAKDLLPHIEYSERMKIYYWNSSSAILIVLVGSVFYQSPYFYFIGTGLLVPILGFLAVTCNHDNVAAVKRLEDDSES